MTQYLLRSLFHLLLVGMVGGSAATASAQGSPPLSYTIYDLGRSTTGLSVSPNGAYVGGYDFTTGAGFLWTGTGGVQTYPEIVTVPVRRFAEPNGVNDSGVAGGWISEQAYGLSPLPVRWSGTNGATLPLPDGVSVGQAYDINNAGTIVGAINTGGNNWYATLFSSTGATVLMQQTAAGGILQFAYGVADNGTVVGQATGTSGSQISAYYLLAGATSAVAIQQADEAFGVSPSGAAITGVSGSNAFIYTVATGSIAALPMLPGTQSAEGRAVNDSGWVVGYAGAAGSIPFLFDGTATYSLQSLLTGTDASIWDMTTGVTNAAYGISNNGIIVGRADRNGVSSGFVMVPVPEPTAAALGALAVAALGLVLRSHRTARHPVRSKHQASVRVS